MLPAIITVKVKGTEIVSDPALLTDIELDHSYSSVRIGANDTLYRLPSSSLADPRTLRVTHEYAKDGEVVNSAIILRQEVTDPVTKRTGYVQGTFKVTRDDSLVTKAQVVAVIFELAALLAANADTDDMKIADGATGVVLESNLSIVSLLNGEH